MTIRVDAVSIRAAADALFRAVCSHVARRGDREAELAQDEGQELVCAPEVSQEFSHVLPCCPCTADCAA